MRRTRDDGIGLDELAQAARNHGMPLEALRYDLTPAGLHYLLIHYDIPAVDPDAWRLEIGGLVATKLSLSLDDLRAGPPVTAPVTLECAGNGRTLYDDRPVSQPWLLEAVGTASWTGTPLAPLLEEAGLTDDAAIATGFGSDRTYHRPAPTSVTATTTTSPVSSVRESESRRSLMPMARRYGPAARRSVTAVTLERGSRVSCTEPACVVDSPDAAST